MEDAGSDEAAIESGVIGLLYLCLSASRTWLSRVVVDLRLELINTLYL